MTTTTPADAVAKVEAIVLAEMPRYRWTADDAVKGLSLKGKRVVITGATSGIGIPTAVAFARTGAHVVFTARDEAKGAATLARCKEAVPDCTVECRKLNLSSYASVAAFAKTFDNETVDVLLHNAGMMALPFSTTEDGDEQQQQVNYLSVVLLTEMLEPKLADGARVVAVSSSAHKSPPALIPNFNFLDALQAYVAAPSEATYNKWVAYGVAKSAVIMYMNALDTELVAAGKNVRCFSVHPGGILTGLQSSVSKEEMMALGFMDAEGNAPPIFKSTAEGASTSVYACVSAELQGKGAVFLENCEVTPKDKYVASNPDMPEELKARIVGTAPHVWVEADWAPVAALARDHLKSKGFLA